VNALNGNQLDYEGSFVSEAILVRQSYLGSAYSGVDSSMQYASLSFHKDEAELLPTRVTL
jgi:hypothetical protein